MCRFLAQGWLSSESRPESADNIIRRSWAEHEEQLVRSELFGDLARSSITMIVLDGATEPHHRGRITFEVSTTATDRPFVGLRCWQGASWVYDGYVEYFDDYMFEEDWFVLDSPYWEPNLDATCTARLFYYDKRGNQKLLATTDFPVAP